MEIGRKIFYEKETGNVILDTGERQGSVIPTTIEQDIQAFFVLSERNRDSFDYIKLEYGQYSQDFAESNGYRINIKTKEIEFSYPDPNEPETPLVFRKPLSQEVEELKEAQAETNTTLLELMEVVILS